MHNGITQEVLNTNFNIVQQQIVIFSLKTQSVWRWQNERLNFVRWKTRHSENYFNLNEQDDKQNEIKKNGSMLRN